MGHMYHRILGDKLQDLAQTFPVVTIIGPRQSGKSTLSKILFPQHAYVNLEDLDERAMAREDPRGFLKRFSTPVIIDEVQRVPALLSYIQGIVDQHNQPGMYVLTGSAQHQLLDAIDQ